MAIRPRFVESTRRPSELAGGDPLLVLAYHPTLARIGETLALGRGVTEISRLAPSLVDDAGRETGPLGDPFVSRQPIAVRRTDGGAIEIANSGVDVSVGGVVLPSGGVRSVGAAALARGVPILLADRVLLWLTTDHDLRGAEDLGLFGCSAAMSALRTQIRDAASARGPILVQGEAGSGKELVARALHAVGPGSGGPYVGVNVAAIPAAIMAAELVGHERGAFPGATERRAGYFERAHKGTLFLDEIGELSETLQPVVLRALELGEIQPIGGTPRAVDAVVVAATDADLEAGVRAGWFRRPLYHRLAQTVITVPPLRDRGVDIALLLASFLREVLSGELADRTTDPAPWLSAAVVAALVRAPWPGNVRQLRAVALRLAAIARAGRTATHEELGLDEPDDQPASAVPRGAAEIGDDQLVCALRSQRFQLTRTADALGISRSHLDALIARSPHVRKARQLDRDEIAACAAALDGEVDAIAAALEVSPRGLRLRMKQLGLC